MIKCEEDKRIMETAHRLWSETYGEGGTEWDARGWISFYENPEMREPADGNYPQDYSLEERLELAARSHEHGTVLANLDDYPAEAPSQRLKATEPLQ
jgi:hypothetical protein